MKDVQESDSPVGLLRRVRWELWALAAGNLTVWAAAMLTVQTVERPFRDYLRAGITGGRAAHFVMLGIVAALVPERPIVGLVAVIGCTLAYGYVVQACGGMTIGFAGLDEGLTILPILAAVQGLRLFMGWRLTTQPLAGGSGSGQFPLSELMEWTTTICIALGYVALHNLCLPQFAFDASLALSYLLYLGQWLLLGVPVALSAFSGRLPNGRTILVLALWCVLVSLALYLAELFIYRGRITAWDLLVMATRGTAPHLAGFFAVLIVNALILRRLGYRWRSPTSVSTL